MSSEAIPTKSTGGDRKPSEKEAMFLSNILGCMKNKPDVDWDAVAEKSGLANGRSAATRFSQIKKGLGWTDGVAAATSSSTPTETPRAKKAVGSGTNTTPSKVAKTPTPRKRTPKIPKVSKSEVEGLVSAANDYLHNKDEDSALIKGEDNAVEPKGEMEDYHHQGGQYGVREHGDVFYDAEDDF